MGDGALSPVAVLRDARESALLRTRLIDDIDGIRLSMRTDEMTNPDDADHQQ
jgi:hypothetical protein